MCNIRNQDWKMNLRTSSDKKNLIFLWRNRWIYLIDLTSTRLVLVLGGTKLITPTTSGQLYFATYY
ncbi:hypothetical protein GLYMA_11G072400v4 [Glycine max]|uniref:Uncharacterized protein n=1 Tax=Glycine max TaxID=3847 RepID=A0A0R0HDA9_SOYBN|nr:hypothetical protein GLYMA_11G072400v4 [Glycine max]KRH28733.1 hypothetical protein GLYMA_11G072400v4 [Glycine max]